MVPRKPRDSSDDLFRSRLDAMIAMDHALVKLAGLIDWSRFDAAFGRFYTQKGRPGLPTRLMAGLHLLKHMEGLSDEAVCAKWVENPYFQFFCGEQFFRHKLVLDRSSMTRWRSRIGAEPLELLLAETLSVAVRTNATTPAACERVTVDTTVQTKAVAHPTDSHLLMRGIEWLNRLARQHDIKLRQSFLRVGRRARRDVSRLIHGRGHKQAMRWVRKLRTWLGRLDRDIGRKIVGDAQLEAAFAVARERVALVLTQKAGDSDKLYALHAPEVECIAKGKARTRYEFGVKTSIAVTNARTAGGQFIVGMQALPGSPYDWAHAHRPDRADRTPDRRHRRARLCRSRVSRPQTRRACQGLHRAQPRDRVTDHPARTATTKRDRADHRSHQKRWPARAKPPRRCHRGCDQRRARRRRSQHAPPDRLDHRALACPDRSVPNRNPVAVRHHLNASEADEMTSMTCPVRIRILHGRRRSGHQPRGASGSRPGASVPCTSWRGR